MTKVGVTGFSGRVGGVICSYLSAKGFDVIGLDMRSIATDRRNARFSNRRVTEIRHFFSKDRSSTIVTPLDDLEVIVHCAGYSGNAIFSNWADIEYANVSLTGILCDAMLNADRPLRFLHFSSSKVYSAGQSNVNESGKLVACDSNTYAGSKVSAENLIEKKLGRSLVNYGLIRLAPLDMDVGRGKLNMIRRVYSTRFPLPIVGQDCDINLAICSVETLQRLVSILVEQILPNGPINMCDDEAVSLRGLMLSSSPVSSIRIPIPKPFNMWLRSVFGAPVSMDNRTLRMYATCKN